MTTVSDLLRENNEALKVKCDKLRLALIVMMRYREHGRYCEVATKGCTCGLREAVDDARKAISEAQR